MMLYRQERNYQRHRFIQAGEDQALAAGVPVFPDLYALRSALQFAVSLEHFTIPPYLCALYSIQEGSDPEAARTIRQIIQSVAVEEMLHMMLAANILNAIGGKPMIGAKEPLPVYPADMPHSVIGFQVNLLPFSKKAINTFLRIERPATRTKSPKAGKFRSIGEFYSSVGEALHRLDREARKTSPNGIFTGTREQQVTREHYYGSGGTLFGVYTLDDAEDALDEIVGQGEGIAGSIEDGDGASFGDDVEYAHYFRFNEIFHERRYSPKDKPDDAPSGDPLRVDWNAVYNMVPNPKMSMFRNQPALLGQMQEFNRMYTNLLANLHQACNGKPEALNEGIPMMRSMGIAAVDLMQQPCGIGNYTAGPSFEIVRKNRRDATL